MKAGREPQQSQNWEKRREHVGFMEQGYPFNEGFPRFSRVNSEPILFTVITRDGSRETATVDYSTQYRAEGLTWMTWPNKEVVYRQVVIAWAEQKDKS